MMKFDTFVQIRRVILYIQILGEEIGEMLPYNDKTNNKRVSLREIMPVVKSTSSGVTSALQLVDTTSNLKIFSDSSALN